MLLLLLLLLLLFGIFDVLHALYVWMHHWICDAVLQTLWDISASTDFI